MNYSEFEISIQNAKLNKKEFAEKTSIPYQTVMNWSRTNKAPSWVKSWLENYIKSKTYEEVKDKILEIEDEKSNI